MAGLKTFTLAEAHDIGLGDTVICANAECGLQYGVRYKVAARLTNIDGTVSLRLIDGVSIMQGEYEASYFAPSPGSKPAWNSEPFTVTSPDRDAFYQRTEAGAF